MRQQRHPI